MSNDSVAIAARFPFGRYAATPWFRSRREHVGNVEWPPSPWRIARALVCSAHRLGDDDLVEATVSLVRRLAEAEPHYVLPPATEIVYAQWMPQLGFDDSLGATQRSENGHTLLALPPDRELAVWWPAVVFDASERHLLERLLAATPYLGQSVSVCELLLRADPPEPGPDDSMAAPRSAESELPPNMERTPIRLLIPEPSVSKAELEVSTADGLVKAMPAPAGSRWVDYIRVAPPSPVRGQDDRLVHSIIHRLEGPLRPPAPGSYHPEIGRQLASRPSPSIEQLLTRACSGLPVPTPEIVLADDDSDGRAERLVVRLRDPRPVGKLETLLAPPNRLSGPAIDCSLRLEQVVWASESLQSSTRELGVQLLAFRLESAKRPPLRDAVAVCETFRRRLLGVAGRRFGADAIPPRLSGKRPGGQQLTDDHHHAHVLAAATDGHEVDLLAVWCPEGLTWDEAETVRQTGTGLRRLLGETARLSPASVHPFGQAARRFQTHTPFLPVRHSKSRRGSLRDSLGDQVGRELERRGLPAPASVRAMAGPWQSFRVVRHAKPGCFPALGAHGFELEFDTPVRGPIALGRNSHFGMGLFLPVSGL